MYRLIVFLLLASFIACQEKAHSPSDNIIEQKPQRKVAFDSLTLNYVMGHFDPSQDDRFSLIDIQYADREGRYMRKEAYDAFRQMYDAALEDGIELKIVSAARNFNCQKGIWERKWTGQTILSSGENAATDFDSDSLRARKILEYSSMPGTSRHHWGTDVDFNNLNNSWFESGEGLKVFNWLEENAAAFGYCRPYSPKGEDRPEGYNEEKWHWSYLPLSEHYTEFASLYLKDHLINNFKGSHVTKDISVVNNYVLGIHHSCKK